MIRSGLPVIEAICAAIALGLSVGVFVGILGYFSGRFASRILKRRKSLSRRRAVQKCPAPIGDNPQIPASK